MDERKHLLEQFNSNDAIGSLFDTVGSIENPKVDLDITRSVHRAIRLLLDREYDDGFYFETTNNMIEEFGPLNKPQWKLCTIEQCTALLVKALDQDNKCRDNEFGSYYSSGLKLLQLFVTSEEAKYMATLNDKDRILRLMDVPSFSELPVEELADWLPEEWSKFKYEHWTSPDLIFEIINTAKNILG